MQTRIAVIVTLALVGVVAAVIAVKLARAAARRLARYLDAAEGFAAAMAGCPPPASIGCRPARGRTPGLRTSSRGRESRAAAAALRAH